MFFQRYIIQVTSLIKALRRLNENSLTLSKFLCFLSRVAARALGSLHIDHQVLHFSVQSLFCLFQRGTFSIHSLDALLCILKTLSQLFPVRIDSKWVHDNLWIHVETSVTSGTVHYLASSSSSVRWMASVSYLLLHWSHLAVGLGHPSLQLTLGLLLPLHTALWAGRSHDGMTAQHEPGRSWPNNPQNKFTDAMIC